MGKPSSEFVVTLVRRLVYAMPLPANAVAAAELSGRQDDLALDNCRKADAEEEADDDMDADAGEEEVDEEGTDAEDIEPDDAGSDHTKGVPVKNIKVASGKKGKKSMSDRAGLTFPVHKFTKALKRAYTKRAQKGAGIFVTAVVEYVAAEILELAGATAKEQKKQRIIPRHIQLAVRNDEELNKYMRDVTIAQGGVLPNIHSVLLSKKPDKRDADAVDPRGAHAYAHAGTLSQEF